MSVTFLDRADWHSTVLAGYTTRDGGCSPAPYHSFNLGAHVGDDPRNVERNRATLLGCLGPRCSVAWLAQVHGSGVVEAAPAPAPAIADASWTARRELACAVLTADCLPVLIAARDGSVVAAAHAGWRGLAAGVLAATVAALPVAPQALQAWLGPCIGPCHFRVGPEVRAAFAAATHPQLDAAFRDSAQGCFADLRLLGRAQLRRAGVTDIALSDACTACDPDRFYSFRRDGQCGRTAAFILRRGS